MPDASLTPNREELSFLWNAVAHTPSCHMSSVQSPTHQHYLTPMLASPDDNKMKGQVWVEGSHAWGRGSLMGRGLQPQGGMEHLQGSPGPHKGSQVEEQQAAQQGALTEWLGWGGAR